MSADAARIPGEDWDEVLIDRLVLPFFIGVHEQEKFRPQNVSISARMLVDRALRERGEYVSYATLADYAIARSHSGAHIRLAEDLAGDLADKALENPEVAMVEITVLKCDIYPQAAGVGVRIVKRQARPGGR